MIPHCRTWRYTAVGGDARNVRLEVATVTAPTRKLALWNGREATHGHWIVCPAWVKRETVGVIRHKR